MALDSEMRWRLVRKAKARGEDSEGEIKIRPAVETDMLQVLEIYNFYIQNSVITFDLEPHTYSAWIEKYRWVASMGLPFLVAESPSGQILGFAYAAPWRAKAAYRRTVEDTLYLRPAATGKRIGTKLLTALIDACKEVGVKEMIAVISDRGAEASLKLHASFGFEPQGHLGKVGFKFGKWLGTHLLQKSL